MQLVGLFVAPQFEVNSFAALSVFEAANAILGERRYVNRVLSTAGGAIMGGQGVEVITHPLDGPDLDTLFVAGASVPPLVAPPAGEVLWDACWSARRVAAIHSGTFALAELGLLDGRRATTHWAFIDDLRARFPLIRVEEDSIFVEDESFWTSAGMSAGVDLALQLLERDIGLDATRQVSAQMVLGQRRYGNNQQRPASARIEPRSDRVQTALSHARANLRSALTVDELAEAACLSPRQFTRLFSQETGCSPARAVEKLRLDAARLLVNQGRLAMDTIANETGFGDAERMRRAFQRAYSQSPRAVRQIAAPRVNV